MDTSTVVIALLGTAVLLMAVALPVWTAWIVAWQSGMEHSARRSFLLTCLLLSYGVLTLTGSLLLPLEMAAVFVAPQLLEEGHKKSATAIWIASQWVPAACFVAGFIASFVVPLSLRSKWQAIASALNSNTSPEPPLRGAG